MAVEGCCEGCCSSDCNPCILCRLFCTNWMN
jgi:hypothetical protein